MSWGIASMVLLVAALGLQLIAFERGRLPARSLALVAALAALAVAGRLAFAPLPNVKPTTDIVLIAGFALGASPGFAVGAITALVSNMVFGQGPWTPWQMLAWGLVGLFGAGLARVTSGRIGRWQLAAAGVVAGLGYGVIMDVSQWLLYGGSPKQSTLIAYSITSLPWNIAHAAGNAVFAIAFGPALIGAVQRATRKLEPVWLPRGVPLQAVAIPAFIVAVIVGSAAVAPVQSHVSQATAQGRGVAWLMSAQRADGGFPVTPGPGASSSPRETVSVAMALAAAGKDLSAVRRPGGKSVVERLWADAHALDAEPEDQVGLEQRLLVAAVAAGQDPRQFGGRDLVTLVRSKVKPSGAVDYTSGQASVDLTAFAVLAMRAAGAGNGDRLVRKSSAWLGRQQLSDGGFATEPRSGAGQRGTPDTTGLVIQAFKAAGVSRGKRVNSALRFLQSAEAVGGGFSFGGPPNAQSTSLALMGLNAYPNASSSAVALSAVKWLKSCEERSGRFDYQPRVARQTPIWVSAQSVLALSKRRLPILNWTPPVLKTKPKSSGRSDISEKTSKLAPKAPRLAKPSVNTSENRTSLQTAIVAARVAGVLVRAFSGANR